MKSTVYDINIFVFISITKFFFYMCQIDLFNSKQLTQIFAVLVCIIFIIELMMHIITCDLYFLK